ncbi:MAG: PspC domain-containing protein [Alistipes sp.]|nr:PspC domain-containing protein [Rikenellaceae bacterium]MBQ4126590.1 PspC domain-containing protein [Alistipes sp.]
MKETINVNLAQQAFTLDMDAYSTLTHYLDDIARRLPDGDNETMNDIESRIAELFRERVTSPMLVITNGVVLSTMNQLGSPENFGEPVRPMGEKADPTAVTYDAPKKFYRSRSDRSIAGVCGGVGKYFNIDPTLIRLIAIVGVFAACSTIFLYAIIWIAVPEEPAKPFNLNK